MSLVYGETLRHICDRINEENNKPVVMLVDDMRERELLKTSVQMFHGRTDEWHGGYHAHPNRGRRGQK